MVERHKLNCTGFRAFRDQADHHHQAVQEEPSSFIQASLDIVSLERKEKGCFSEESPSLALSVYS